LLACLGEQCLEVRHAEAVEVAHGGDRIRDALTGHGVAGGVDLLSAAAHEALGAAQVAEQIGVEQLYEQAVQFRVDEARLREQLLRRRLVVRLRCRREVGVDLDAPAIAIAAAGMNGEALEFEEDLDLVLRQFDA
jgi:hypothetical protein